MVTIGAEGGDEPAALDLVRRYLDELHRRLGIEACAGDVEAEAITYRPPSGAFLVARQAGVAVGCAAVRVLAPGVGEAKRMWVAPALRGRGVGARLLDALEDEARRLGCRTLRLDTRRELTEAVALYQRAGYQEVPPYNDNRDADAWFEKAL